MATQSHSRPGTAELEVAYAEYRVLLSCQRTLLAFARTALALAVALLHSSDMHPAGALLMALCVVVVGVLQYASMSALVLAGRPAWKSKIVSWLGCAMGWHVLAGAVVALSVGVAVGFTSYGGTTSTPVVL